MDALRAACEAGDPYHFALLDYQMPEVDGGTLAAAIKREPALEGTVVIMLTSAGHWNEIRREQAGSVDACLVKPVRQSQLWNTLATAWAKRHGAVLPDRAKPQRRIAEFRASLAARFAGGMPRILIAEDNSVNQKVAIGFLDRLGIRADVAGNGKEAIEMYQMLRHDLIFMDCQMPEVDGYAATREIRRREGAGRRVAIIAMTAEAMEGCREVCLAAGMDDYIAKPIRVEDLAGSAVALGGRARNLSDSCPTSQRNPAQLQTESVPHLDRRTDNRLLTMVCKPVASKTDDFDTAIATGATQEFARIEFPNPSLLASCARRRDYTLSLDLFPFHRLRADWRSRAAVRKLGPDAERQKPRTALRRARDGCR